MDRTVAPYLAGLEYRTRHVAILVGSDNRHGHRLGSAISSAA